MSILDKYGIKEVADVTFYEINSDGSPGAPVLYLDTLKVSTIEQTAEQTEARGGKGNPPLIIWDFGKEINVTLEDALFSAKSMAVMFGNGRVGGAEALGEGATATLKKTIVFKGETVPTTWEDAMGNSHEIKDGVIYKADGTPIGSETPVAGESYFITFDYEIESPGVITIGASTFPGTYYVTGDTFARSEITGRDEYYQFILPKAKMMAENTITLEAEGDPSVFNMSLRVLRGPGGDMMKLVKYDVTNADEEAEG